MPNPDVGPLAYDLLIRLGALLRVLPPLRSFNGSGPPADLQEILLGLYRFLGMEGVELVAVEDADGSVLYERTAALIRRCSTLSPAGRVRLPVLETPGLRRRVVLMDSRFLQAFIPVHVAHLNEECP